MNNRFNHYIYMDHGATTPVLKEVAKAAYDAMTLYFGNASEPHLLGVEAKNILEHSRNVIAGAINANPDEIIFTSGGTESNNLAIFGVVECYYKKGNHIITSEIEHPAVHMPLKILENEGFDVTYIPVDNFGIINPNDVKKAIKPTTILISVMHANNIMGSIQPIEEIGKIAKESDVVFHCDAIQSYLNIPIDVDTLNVDLLSISGHKVYAPKGIGALYVRHGIKIMPQIFGGGQEKGKRSGTENIPNILGFAKATEILFPSLSERRAYVSQLRDYIKDEVLKKISDVIYNGHPKQRLPGNINLTFEPVEGIDIVKKLNEEYGIAISTGSACKSASKEANEALLAIGLCPAMARSSIRISIGFENTKEEADYLVEALNKTVLELRNYYQLQQENKKDKYFIFKN